MRALVIGGGVIGACVAYRLSQRGVTVTVVEAAGLGSGTSRRSFAWTNANGKHPREYSELHLAGFAAYRRLTAEFSDQDWHVPTGNLAWDGNGGESSLEEHQSEILDTSYPISIVSAERATADLEPDVNFGKAEDPVAFYPTDAHVYPLVMIRDLLRRAQDLGAEVRTGCKVHGLLTTGERVSGVQTHDGDLYGDIVVNCSGYWSNDITRNIGVSVPLVDAAIPGSSSIGLLALTSQAPARLRRVLHGPGISVRPHGAGRLLLHCKDLDNAARPESPIEDLLNAASPALERLEQILPAARSAQIEAAYVGLRPMPEDGVSVIGWAQGISRLYQTVTHSGVCLAPLIGEVAATEILGGDVAMDSMFRPGRPH